MSVMAVKARRRPAPKTKGSTKGNTKGTAKGLAVMKYPPPPFIIQQFNILPAHLFSQQVNRLLSFMTSSVQQQRRYIIELMRFPYTTPDSQWSIDVRSIMKVHLHTITKTRYLFRVFLSHWRYKKLHDKNDDDIATLEPPKNPVHIIDWQTKSKYSFEATTLMRDITARLLNHDGFWDSPQAPRNPFTNLPLTLSQMISVWNQLSYARIPCSTAFTAYRQCRWDMHRFTFEYATMTQLNALTHTMKNELSQDYRDRMLDFIEYVHDYMDIPCTTQLYRYSMIKHTGHLLFRKWAALCKRFYEYDIIYKHAADTRNSMQILAVKEAALLIGKLRCMAQEFGT